MTKPPTDFYLTDQLSGWHLEIEEIYLSVYPQKKASEAALLTRLIHSPVIYGIAASIDANLAGFILLQGTGDSSDILEICVRPVWQNSGVGRKLLQAGLASPHTGQHSRVLLEVAEDNHIAQHLYLQAGFALIGRRAQYYHRAEKRIDALVMEKQLGSQA